MHSCHRIPGLLDHVPGGGENDGREKFALSLVRREAVGDTHRAELLVCEVNFQASLFAG